MKIHQKIIGTHVPLRVASASALLLALTLTACASQRDKGNDLAVEKVPYDELQATNFLPLNADKPGTPVNPEVYLVRGKYTIVEYFSPFDANCMSFEPRLIQLSQSRTDIAVRNVNVNRPGVEGIDWESPILQNAQIQGLPYFKIYDPTRCLRAKGRPAYEQVVQWTKFSPSNFARTNQY